ncbi:MAG: WG repeat-containing protein [Clostridiales bacterium]|nr:WG repeat-containing protein [Clostridiales bacterium]
MRASKGIVTVLLILLIAFGWAACALGIGTGAVEEGDANTTGNYNQCIALAEDYMERGLYQKAAVEYTTAVSLKNNEEDWAALLEAYRCRYEEDDDIFSVYLSAAKKATKAYPKNTDFCKIAVNLCLENDDYSSAYQYLTLNRDTGVADEELEQLYLEVKYSYTIGSSSWSQRLLLCNEYYAAYSGNGWGIVSSAGKKLVSYTLESCYSIGENGIYVCSEDGQGKLCDLDGIVQGKLSFVPTDAGVYTEGLVAIQNGDTWSYYDELGDLQFGEYLNASSFQDGTAAVETEDGWILIDTAGNEVSSAVYEDIKLNADGSWLKNGVMLAKLDGAYHLYDENGEQLGSLTCDDIDCVTDNGSMIAFERDGLWGFADLEGNEVIEPTYANAKSFSNGLAAVQGEIYWGFINTENILVIDYTFLDADYFDDDGICMVATASDTYQLLTRNITD